MSCVENPCSDETKKNLRAKRRRKVDNNNKYNYIFAIKVFIVMFTAISRKVIGKNVHATIPKGKIGSIHCS